MREVAEEQIELELAAMARNLAAASLRPAMEELATIAQAGFADNFQRASGPHGAWPARKDPGDEHPLLIDPKDEYDLLGATQAGGTGNVTDIGERELSTGVRKDDGHPGAAVHNFGLPERNIDQREYLYASEDTLSRMAGVLADSALTTIFVF